MFESNNYYCFVAGLPELYWEDRKLSLPVKDFMDQAKEYLNEKSLEVLNLFFLPADNAQVLRLLQKAEPERELSTVFALRVLEAEIAEPTGILPSYLREFIADFKAEKLKYDVAPENVLSWMYYDYLLKSSNRLVCRYAAFSRDLKNLITASNCRKFGRDVEKEVVGNDVFATALRISTAKDFGLGMDYPFTDKVFALFNNPNLVERERGLDLLIWDFLDETVIFKYFTTDNVVCFMLKLMIVERWSKMDSESGRVVFMEMVERFRKSFQFTEEFSN